MNLSDYLSILKDLFNLSFSIDFDEFLKDIGLINMNLADEKVTTEMINKLVNDSINGKYDCHVKKVVLKWCEIMRMFGLSIIDRISKIGSTVSFLDSFLGLL
jgi:hypothetical protein